MSEFQCATLLPNAVNKSLWQCLKACMGSVFNIAEWFSIYIHYVYSPLYIGIYKGFDYWLIADKQKESMFAELMPGPMVNCSQWFHAFFHDRCHVKNIEHFCQIELNVFEKMALSFNCVWQEHCW